VTGAEKAAAKTMSAPSKGAKRFDSAMKSPVLKNLGL
jgi:hypothetical protein